MHKRLSLWRATVVTSALYSLLASGFTAKSFATLRVVLTRQARAIARSPRHLELESDDRFWQRVGFAPPAELVLQRMHKAIETTDSLRSSLEAKYAGIAPGLGAREQAVLMDLCAPFWSQRRLTAKDARIAPALRAREQAVLMDLRSILEPAEVDGVEAEAEGDHICLECGVRFGTREALRGHVAKLHSSTRMQAAQQQLIVFDRQKHGKDGMPTCAGCNHRFDRWADLEKHVVENHCQFQQDAANTADPARSGR
eukprot:s13733_g1.t1